MKKYPFKNDGINSLFFLCGVLFWIAFPALSVPVFADTIYFKNGTRLDIPEAWEEDGQVKCVLYGQVVSYPVEDVERIEKEEVGKPPDPPSEALQQAQRYHILAAQHARDGKWYDAIAFERKAVALAPENAGYKKKLSLFCNNYGIELKKKNKLREALSYLQQSLTYAPDQLQVKKNIAALYVLQATAACDKSDYRTCEKLLSKAQQYDDANAELFFLKGKAAYAADNNEKAREYWLQALKIDPTSRHVRAYLHKLGQEDSVESDLASRDTAWFKLKFEAEENSEVARETLRVLRDAVEKVGRDLDFQLQDTITVIVHPQSDLKQLEYFPDWAAGVYDGKIRIGADLFKKSIYAKSILYHEYTHAVVYRIAGKGVPLWLNEGLAEYEGAPFFKPKTRRFRNILLRKARRQNKLISFSMLENVNLSFLNMLTIRLVYAQSESFVTYLINRYSLYDMRTVLERIGKGHDFQKIVVEVFGEDLASLEKKWRDSL